MSDGRSVLVTRPQPDADRTAALLREAGLDPVIAPLMRIVTRSGALPPTHSFDTVAFTSANGVRAMADATADRPPCFAVGEASAAEARASGFPVTGIGSGDVASLAHVIAAAKPGTVLHAAGAALAGDLGAMLAESGVPSRRVVLYEAVAEEALPPRAIRAVEEGLFAVLLLSPRSAKLLSALIVKAGLEACLARTILAALSPAVAEAFPLPTARRVVPPAPRLPALVDFLSGGGT